MDVTLQFDAFNVQPDGDDRNRLFSLVDGLVGHRTLGSYSASQLKTIATYASTALDNDDDESDVLRGLSLLGVLVEQSSSSVFAELHYGWTQSLLRVLTRTGDSGVRLLAAETLALVLEYAAGFPEFARQLSTSIVPQLVQQQLAVESVGGERDLSDALLMLTVMRRYPGACRTNASALRRRIMNLLMITSQDKPELESKAAKCLALLPDVGGVYIGSNKSNALEANWNKLYAQLCGSIHLVLDDLYDGHEGERTTSHPTDTLPPSWMPEQEQSDDADLTPCRRLRILLLCLGEMLTVDSDSSVRSARSIPVEDTMALLCRILNVNLKTLAASRIGRRTLLTSISLPEIHRKCLRVLKRLLTVCGRHMSLHGTSVLGIVMKTLQWTGGSGGGISEPNVCHPMARLRIAAYDVLVTWLEVVQSPSSLTNVQEPLIANLLRDVMLKRTNTNVVLGASNGSKQRPKKKVKRDFESVVDVVHRKASPWADSDLCLAAFDALSAILCYAVDVLQTRCLKEIHETALKVCRSVQSAVGTDFPLPYGHADCRVALYELAAATLVHRTPNFCPDLATCIGIFSRGATLDGHRKIGRCCTRALATCHLLTNPYRLSMFAACSESPNPIVESVMEVEDDVVRTTSSGFGQIPSEEKSDSLKDNVEITLNGGIEEEASDQKTGHQVLEIVLESSPEVTVQLDDDEEEEEEGMEEEEPRRELEIVEEPEIVDEQGIVDFSASQVVDRPPDPQIRCPTEDTMQMISSFVDSRPDDV